ncbi:MAG: FAD-binding oxidoreductase, partial [Octadecabacter sp.]|nr:FAD-binding oxidoreductase [Octadecabacter sp.]
AQVLARDIAVADSKFVVNYFRLSEDNRLLFGGRANYAVGFPRNIEPALRQRMEHMFPQLKGVGIDYVWGGTLGITRHRLPLVTRVADNILSAGGYSGHGLAHSGFAGKLMAEAVRGQAERFDIFAALPVPSFPGGTMLRAPLLAAAMTWYSLRDKLGL